MLFANIFGYFGVQADSEEETSWSFLKEQFRIGEKLDYMHATGLRSSVVDCLPGERFITTGTRMKWMRKFLLKLCLGLPNALHNEVLLKPCRFSRY